MTNLQFDAEFDIPPGFRADAVMGDSVFEVLVAPRDLRQVMATVMDVARCTGTKSDRRGILILDEPLITEGRLREEWSSIQGILRPEVVQRLALVIHREGGGNAVVGSLGSREGECVLAVVEHARRHVQPRLRGPSNAWYDILRILITQWIKGAGPITSLWLGEAAGCSYPTVASALEKLERYLVRHSDRRVELKAFPKDAWFRLVANADKVRQTFRFADHSGQPRSVGSLVSRLQKLRPEGVAIGGVMGARRRYPALDLVKTPRLDLTLHCRARQPDLGFLRLLDPGLKPAEGEDPARLVIHLLRYPHRFCETDADGVLWADPVECLLDLHEMRLESQALELLRAVAPNGVIG